VVFLAELINIALKVKALFYLFATVLNSYESKYKTIFPYNHLFQTVCLAVVYRIRVMILLTGFKKYFTVISNKFR
jgi:hypothetical protein